MIDTINHFGVAVSGASANVGGVVTGDEIAVIVPPIGRHDDGRMLLSRDEALNLAAWLVAVADRKDETGASLFALTLAEIKRT